MVLEGYRELSYGDLDIFFSRLNPFKIQEDSVLMSGSIQISAS